jgi:hypothetical protein
MIKSHGTVNLLLHSIAILSVFIVYTATLYTQHLSRVIHKLLDNKFEVLTSLYKINIYLLTEYEWHIYSISYV